MKKQSSTPKIELANEILKENLTKILSVEEWAKACGYRNADFFRDDTEISLEFGQNTQW